MAVIAVLAVACGSPMPEPSRSPVSATPVSTPTAATSTPSATPATVRVDDWTATCLGVPEAVCLGVARVFVGNLGKLGGRVLHASGGSMSVEERSVCPDAVPDYMDRALCWQASAPGANVCMIVAASLPEATQPIPPFGQVGGDNLTGLAGAQPVGWPPCE